MYSCCDSAENTPEAVGISVAKEDFMEAKRPHWPCLNKSKVENFN